jgi:prepilin-type N-terminal cleavage/methylation domain-containing protein
MKRFIKNDKGMTLIEVILAVAILGVVTFPLMVSFMNTLALSKKIDQENEVNAITRIVKEKVAESIIQENYLLKFKDPALDGLSIRTFIGDSIFIGGTVTSDDFSIVDSAGSTNDKYFFSVTYDNFSCYDADYAHIYHVIITIKTSDVAGTEKVLNKLKIAVDAGKVLP